MIGRLLSVAALLFLLMACRISPLTPEQAAADRRTIVAWLECEECTSNELKAVMELGNVALPSLIAVLREGPSPASRESLRRHLITTYVELKSNAGAKVSMSETEYVKTYMDNYVALYQIRAAKALAVIGGADAKKALAEALREQYRKDVMGIVRASLQMLKSREGRSPP